MSFFRFFFIAFYVTGGFSIEFYATGLIFFFKYSNSILVLKIKKRSFFWCNFYKKIMSYERVINV
ncbi:hypothetical protein HanRHA438_Chr15g0698571 [Helianthus annuus]|nr:hypothetical protein HanRHA438_Chr15g0698571 [Helianthus annuus]